MARRVKSNANDAHGINQLENLVQKQRKNVSVDWINFLFVCLNSAFKIKSISLAYSFFFWFNAEECPPGTMARARLRANQKYQNSLMPFCRKCPPAQYQSNFNQNKCLSCPFGMTSPRGAISIENCFEEKRDICKINTGICGPHGICVQENGNHHLYSCLCEDGFTGKLSRAKRSKLFRLNSSKFKRGFLSLRQVRIVNTN